MRFLIASVLFFAACARAMSTAPVIRSFPRGCPDGWTFYYVDRTIVDQRLVEVYVCRK